MTSQEQQMIAGLIDRVQHTQLGEKDPEAEQMLQQGLSRTPDAIYILAQTVLVQQYALEQAQRQLADARQQSQRAQSEPKHATSFLGSLFGHGEPASPPPAPAYQPVPNYAPPSAPPPGSYPAPQYGAPGIGAPAGGGFLRSALQTATGVAAGALAFQGIESLMHGFGGSGGGFGGGEGFGGSAGRPEEIVNNYYGDSGRDAGQNLSPDIEDRRGDDAAFGAPTDLADTDSGNTDDSSFDNNDDSFNDGSTDTSSFDDGGGDDLGSGDNLDSGDDSSFS